MKMMKKIFSLIIMLNFWENLDLKNFMLNFKRFFFAIFFHLKILLVKLMCENERILKEFN